MKKELYFEIETRFKNIVKFNIKASSLSSYKTGGNISVVIYPENLNDVLDILNFLKTENLNFFICGRATNILVSDEGFDGVFIKTDRIKNLHFNDIFLEAECGCVLDDLVSLSISRGLKGLERLSWIPGSVGGAIRMNAGAFGSEIFDKLEYFDAINLSNLKFERIYKRDINYGYRYVQNIEKYFIVSGFFVLERSEISFLEKIRKDIIKKRIDKQPLEYPSAGSVFKRPKNDYASRLIEFCGLKGKKIGGAMVSEKHAGFIVNIGNATSSDIYKLINLIKEEVYKKTGINLELEQILVGSF